jgi:lipopolysaccharide transport system ATP-binding protein
MSDVVIKVENLSKQYRLGTVGTGTLSHDLNRFWAKVRGKEDPYLKVGEVNDRTQKGHSDYVWALKDINFEVKRGEVLGIIGKNGAGKSTLLKILSQVTTPTTGSVKMKGRVGSLLEVGTGFHPELTGRENIYLNGAILGMRRHEITRKLDEIIDFAGVEKYIDTPVKRYSSGMTVRLGFAVAAHLEPEILIVDEVLAVGDAEFQKKCLGKMNDVSKNEGRTILFVSHNLGAIERISTRGVIIANGEIVYQSNLIQDVIKNYQKKSVFDNSSYDVSQYDSKYLRLNDFFIGDEKGRKIDYTIPVNESFYVYINGDILEFEHGLQVGITIYTKDGDAVFRSYHTDQIESMRPKHKTGANLFKVKIPAYFLNEGDYVLEMAVVLYMHRKWIYEPGFNSPFLNFEIKDGFNSSEYWTTKRIGIVSPILYWEIL